MMPGSFVAAYVFMLAAFTGFEVISKVPVVLHTPLMSGANAIHGIVLVGGILVLAQATTPLEIVLGLVAVVFGAMNVAGGFVVTDRMLEMFRSKPRGPKK
jgi:NAD(P) transhydrogenase subunit alpha